MSAWNPDLYLKFEKERTQPSIDLVARIDVSSPERIIDIGCGPGNGTKILREKFPNSRITGIDSSSEMIDKAKSAYPPGRVDTRRCGRVSIHRKIRHHLFQCRSTVDTRSSKTNRESGCASND